MSGTRNTGPAGSAADAAQGNSFEEIRNKYLTDKAAGRPVKLFEDTEFPAVAKSIYYSKKPSSQIVWRRPHEICSDPRFIVEGATRFDLDQGELDNCWFIAAAATVALKQELLAKVVPDDQNFTDKYAGIFRFKFWRYGAWKEVMIDDRLPVKFGRLVFCRNKEQPNEFWSALLEKAYAKLNGSYEALRAGKIQEALVDLTGGVGEVLAIQDRTADQLFSLLQDMEKMNTLMGCSISKPGIESGQQVGDYGLINRHAYCITDVARVSRGTQKVRVIRLLNPWGKVEWTGAWSENSSEWNEITAAAKTELGVTAQEDGEFWMSFDDWRRNFTELQLCHLTFSSQNRVAWFERAEHGAWRSGQDGGCGEPPYSPADGVWRNPQYLVVVREPTAPSASNKSKAAPATAAATPAAAGVPTSGNLIISLMQKYRRELQTMLGVYEESCNLTIGYRVFQIKDNSQSTMNATFIPLRAAPVEEDSRKYAPLREVTYEYLVAPGTYCVIPTTQFSGQEADFMLRVLTKQEADLQVVSDPERITPQSYRLVSVAPSVQVTGSRNLMDGCAASTIPAKMAADSKPDALQIFDTQLIELYQRFCPLTASIGLNELMELLNTTSAENKLGPYALSFGRSEARLMYNYCSILFESPTITCDIYQNLVQNLQTWTGAFANLDADQNQYLPLGRLWKAFTAAGREIDSKARQAISASYVDPKSGHVHVMDFICCMAKVLSAQTLWSKRQTKDGKCKMTLNELMQHTLMT